MCIEQERLRLSGFELTNLGSFLELTLSPIVEHRGRMSCILLLALGKDL